MVTNVFFVRFLIEIINLIISCFTGKSPKITFLKSLFLFYKRNGKRDEGTMHVHVSLFMFMFVFFLFRHFRLDSPHSQEIYRLAPQIMR